MSEEEKNDNLNSEKKLEENSNEEQENSDNNEEQENDNEEDDDEIIDLDDVVQEKTDEVTNEKINNETKENKQLPINAAVPNPNISLHNLDMNILPKEDVLNFLLNSNDLFFSPNNSNIMLTENTMMKTKNKKSYKVNSTICKDKNKPSYLLPVEINSPEYTYDFHTAVKKMVSNISKTENYDDKLIKLLLDKNVIKKCDLLDTVNKEHIQNKIKNFIDKKTRHLDVIQEKLNEDFTQSHPFCPKTNVHDKTHIGDLNEFLNGQYNHLKKVDENIRNMKEETEKKVIMPTNPKIDDKSVKIFNEKMKTEEKVYDRLYKKRNNKENIFKNIDKTSKISSKSNIETSTNYLYNQFFKKNEKFKELEQKVAEERTHQPISSLQSSNKMILVKFVNDYNEAINFIFDKNDQKDNLNLIQFVKISSRLNLIMYKKDFEELISNYQEKTEILSNFNKSKLINEERKLLLEAFDILKNKEGLVNKENLFIFIVCVINLYDYYLIKVNNDRKVVEPSPKVNNNCKDKIVVNNLASKTKKEFKENLLKEVDLELTKRIKTNKRFVGYDDDNNQIINLQMSHLIRKHFNPLSINYFSKENFSEDNKFTSIQSNNTFKPSTNAASDKLSSNFRRKIKNEAENINDLAINRINSSSGNKERKDKNGNTLTKNSAQDNEEKFNLNYINLLLLLKKKKEKLMAKKRVDLENKEISECSFKPKINIDYSFSQSNNEISTKNERFDKLYKMGTKMLLNRKDRLNEDLEVEKNAKECIFKPVLLNKEVNFDVNVNSFQNISNQKQFDRLKKGRLERKIREIANSREPFQTVENIEITNKKNKQTTNLSKSVEIPNKDKVDHKEKNDLDKLNEVSNNNMKSLHKNETKDEKKEQIPLLIIDVNLRPGEKKKIYVLDGDTADGLAEKFSKEHNLDLETRNKLKILIQSHMSKLLLKIEEEKENQSINSDISFTNNI